VLGDYLDRKFPILHIAHSDQLVRTQRRNSVRAEVNTTGRVFPLKSVKEADETFGSPGGYKCKMVDISEDGAAVLIGGRAKPGMPVKIETEIGDAQIVMSGVVKGVTFKQNKNVSILHIQASPPSPAMKNKILTFVYGIFQEKEKTRTQLSSVLT
jgi:c-di-GMP-binding flagellar brake protein YcgR